MSLGGIDYDPGPYNLTIPAGDTSLLFTIPLSIDGILESDEEFEMIIDGASLEVLISTEPARVVIVDNGSEYLHIICSI